MGKKAMKGSITMKYYSAATSQFEEIRSDIAYYCENADAIFA
jgi:hypothetical protein